MFNQSRRNLARWFTLSMGGILFVFTGVVYYQKAVDELEVLDRLLYAKAQAMAAGVESEPREGQWQVNLENVPFLGSNIDSGCAGIVYCLMCNDLGRR